VRVTSVLRSRGRSNGRHVIGLMSGTSADGIDAALVQIQGHGQLVRVRPLAFRALPFPPSLQRRILDASVCGTVAEVCHLNALLGELFAQAAQRVMKAARLGPDDIELIGSHGQTIHHRPIPVAESGVGRLRSSLQIGEPAVIAERTGIMTVANFRARDIAAGGEGAPLTPYVHYLLLRHPRRSRLIVNLGGIGNVTYLLAGGVLENVQAFDTGPANMMLDGLAQRLSRGRSSMDRDGQLAATGVVNRRLLAKLRRHPFLKRRPPKSTGREEFGESFLKQVLTPRTGRAADLLATCTLFTAETVGDARRWLNGPVNEVIVCGGGVRNKTLMRDLAAVMAPTPLRTLEDVGWESKSFEAIAFAVLAYQTMSGESANVPTVTGARHAVVLGSIVPPGPGYAFSWPTARASTESSR
jgi:anhydro-N-acetylmuramic acid kinase